MIHIETTYLKEVKGTIIDARPDFGLELESSLCRVEIIRQDRGEWFMTKFFAGQYPVPRELVVCHLKN